MDNKILNKCIFGAMLLSLAACTQDEMSDNGNTLPEGVYPLEIASVTMSVESSSKPWSADVPQTRVSENSDGMSSHWEGGETIHVKLGNQETTYEVTDANGSLNLTGEQLYWTKRTDNVTAWYPENGTINLADQSDKLAYVLQAKLDNASCDEAVALNFTHALAKVRVALKGSDAGKVDDVKIKTYTSCTHTQGTIDAGGAMDGWITMMECERNGVTYWEANVVPGKKITQFLINKTTEGTLENDGITPLAAKVNTITLTVGEDIITGGTTITSPGDYLMKGDYSQTVTINCEGEVTLTLDGMTSTAATAIKVESGHPTIIVKGENVFNQPSDSGPSSIVLDGDDAHITLDGQGSGKLTIKQIYQDNDNGEAVIGGEDNKSTGNIEIKNMSLHIDLSERRMLTGAVIGSGTAYDNNTTCGNISIFGTELTVTGGDCIVGGAVVGTGMGQGPGYNKGSVAGCGDITITLRQGDTKDAFLNKLDVKPLSDPNAQQGDKVGKGSSVNGGSCETGKITWYSADGIEIK